MTEVYLLLGSNQGMREVYLQQAREALSKQAGSLRNASSVYETAAWGNEDQQAFLNQVLLLDTILSPSELLQLIHQTEADLGRVRLTKWEARSIDIDILYFGNQVLQTDKLVVPHPHLQERRFTLAPLAEIAPDYQHPLLKKTNRELLADCSDPLPVKKLS